MKRWVAVFVVSALLASPAVAKDANAIADEAKALAKRGKYVEAVELCVDEIVAGQKKKDLQRQYAAWSALASREFKALGVHAKHQADYVKCLKLLLMKLDPKTTSGICSAGQVAHALLFHASRTGDTTHVAQAAEVAAAYAKLKKTGRHARAMGDYAAGMDLVAAGKATEACRSLSSALKVASDEGWSYTAVHVATELAAAYLAGGSEEDAATALAGAKAALDATNDGTVFQFWRDMVKTRLPDASETVLAAFNDSAENFRAGMAGAAGGRGARAGQGSKVGDAWKKLSKKKPFVSMLRTDSGFRMTQSFDKRFEKEAEFGTGVKHVDDGGITIAYFDRGVALRMLDLVGNKGQPGESSHPGPFQFFTPLAKGETWGITKAGTIIVK